MGEGGGGGLVGGPAGAELQPVLKASHTIKAGGRFHTTISIAAGVTF